ncbi:hypothetical protein QYF61_017714 [Mycteria americana]|uniref:Reverse transcriptase domain-containing protein n=1 Tax=Mycteria americana TaxID=33587 RepID=A0AAN7SII2_MYCAM|nr:hypothetical protein QYF61_017714 [Mycteria americana]
MSQAPERLFDTAYKNDYHATTKLLQAEINKHGVPPTGDIPPQTSPAWVPPMGCSSSQTAPVWVLFHRVQSFRNRLLQRGSPTGSQVLPANLLQHGVLSLHGVTGPARSLLQHGLPMGSQPPSGIHLLQCGVLHGLQVDICSTIYLHGLQGDSLPHHGLHHGLKGISALDIHFNKAFLAGFLFTGWMVGLTGAQVQCPQDANGTQRIHSSIWPVQKSNGEWRLTVDCRGLKEVTPPLSAAVLDIQYELESKVAKWYVTIDITNVFFSIPLAAECRPQFAFTWRGVQYIWNQLPQGWKHSPTICHGLIQTALAQGEKLQNICNILMTLFWENGPTWSLWQKAPGDTRGRPLGFWSWGYRGSEASYTPTEIEILAAYEGEQAALEVVGTEAQLLLA